jgi:hypothetical protein
MVVFYLGLTASRGELGEGFGAAAPARLGRDGVAQHGGRRGSAADGVAQHDSGEQGLGTDRRDPVEGRRRERVRERLGRGERAPARTVLL